MADLFHEHHFANGLHLLVEPIADFKSAAYTFLVPAGIVADPDSALGTANLVSELVTRGAGERDSRDLTAALDNLGLQRHESAGIYHTTFAAATVGRNLLPGLGLLADVLRRPKLESEQLRFCKEATLQELDAVEDDPGQKLFIELRRQALPAPLGRPVLGTKDTVAALMRRTVAGFHKKSYRPNGAILGVAGAVDFAEVKSAVERLFGDWEPGKEQPVTPSPAPAATRGHIASDKIQTHIGLAFDSVAYPDPDFFNAHGAVGVLSGGSSARLFTEVREKRGLCYSVGASFVALRDRGVVFCYAGTTNERAAQTLEVLLAEIGRLKDGIGEDEVRRVKAGLKSALVMQEESTAARAGSMARSWFYLGRVRTLEEVARAIDALTPESILGYLERHPPRDYTILTLGPEPLPA